MRVNGVLCSCGGMVVKRAPFKDKNPIQCVACGKVAVYRIGGKGPIHRVFSVAALRSVIKLGELLWLQPTNPQKTEFMVPEKLLVCLEVGLDEDAESPLAMQDTWKLVTLNMGLIHDAPAGWKLEDEDIPKASKTPRFWTVSCHRHGGWHWFLANDQKVVDPWDTRRVAGYLILKQPKDIPADKRENDARMLLEEYDAWTNGDCWWGSMKLEVERPVDPKVMLHAPCPHCKCGPKPGVREFLEPDQCCGFLGEDRVIEYLVEEVQHANLVGKIRPDTHRIKLTIRNSEFFGHVGLRTKLEELGYEVECNRRPHS